MHFSPFCIPLFFKSEISLFLFTPPPPPPPRKTRFLFTIAFFDSFPTPLARSLFRSWLSHWILFGRPPSFFSFSPYLAYFPKRKKTTNFFLLDPGTFPQPLFFLFFFSSLSDLYLPPLPLVFFRNHFPVLDAVPSVLPPFSPKC